jgi:hypothetical protein
LKSEHWLDIKRRYRASGLPQACWCGETKVDLHHVTYKRIGRENLTDLRPLCRKHHDEIHAVKTGARTRSKTPVLTRRMKRKLARSGTFETCPSPAEVLAARTPKGGWTKAQMIVWGLPWPPPKGWRKDLERRYENRAT